MPFMQAIASRANAELTSDKLKLLDPNTFAQPGTLVETLKSLKIIGGPREADETSYIAGFPSGLQEAVRAVLHENLNPETGPPVGVTVAWSPGYDDEVKFFQIANSDKSEGGITILVKSRYPGDRSGAPGTGIKG